MKHECDKKGNEKEKAFLDELVEVYRRHGFSLSHQDSHGSFEVEEFDEYNVEWLYQANIETR